ncbi:MAG: RidA family protein [Steroidobacteraceae bacterium]
MSQHFVRTAAALSFLTLAAQAGLAAESGVIRNGNAPGRPILSSVEVPASKNLVFLSGQVPSATNPDAPREQQTLGDMETQTMSVLTKIEDHLKSIGLSMGDVVKAQAFLVADPATGKVDRDGFNKAFAKFFGTDKQPNKPTRSAFVIAGLGSPTMFVEIEDMAVRPYRGPDGPPGRFAPGGHSSQGF